MSTKLLVERLRVNVCVWFFFLLLRSYERNERRRVANSNRKFRWERTGSNPVPYRLNLLLINIFFSGSQNLSVLTLRLPWIKLQVCTSSVCVFAQLYVKTDNLYSYR